MAATVVVAAAVALGLWRSGAGAGPPLKVAVTVSRTAVGEPVPADFIGLSMEYSSAAAYLGNDPSAPNTTFVRLVRALAPTGHPVLRFGGDSTDYTWWPVPGVAQPGGIKYVLTPSWLAVARATARALGARLILGINLEADSSAIAATEASELLSGLGPGLVDYLELGNEPELYGKGTWYTTASGEVVHARPRSYGVSSYIADFRRISAALPRGVPLAGPASGAPKWLASVPEFAAANPRVRLVTFHVYPLDRCYRSTSPRYATIAHLLAPAAATEPARFLAPALTSTQAASLPLRADEFNSVSCRGRAGVSNTFAAALWVVNGLFDLVRAGVTGVNVHTLAGALYQPFSFVHSGGRWRARVSPLYYGLLLFTRAAPAGSRLLATSGQSDPSLASWATRDGQGTVRVVLINDSTVRDLAVTLRVPRSGGAATVERLEAPSARALSGVTLAGQSFGPRTATGELRGRLREARLRLEHGRYVVSLPAASAALVTLPAGG